MSFKVLKRANQVPTPEAEPQQLGKAGRIATQIPTQIGKGAASLADLLADVVGPAHSTPLFGLPENIATQFQESYEQRPRLTDLVQEGAEGLLKQAGYAPEGLIPQGALEETLANISQFLGGELPVAAFTGGLSPRGLLGRAIGGGTLGYGARKAGEALDLPQGAQTALELGGTLTGAGLGGYISNYGFRTPTRVLHKNLEKQKAPLYDKAREAAQEIEVAAPQAAKKLDALEKKLARRAPAKKSDIRDMINTFQDITQDPTKISLPEVVDIKKDINEAWLKATTQGQKEFLNQLRTIAKDEILAPAARAHPEWGQTFNAAEEITQFLGGAPNFKELVNKNPSVRGMLETMGPIGYVLASVYAPKTAIPLALLKGTQISKREGKEIWRALQTNPTSRKAVSDMIEATYLNKPEQVVTALRTIKNTTDKPSKSFKILKKAKR